MGTQDSTLGGDPYVLISEATAGLTIHLHPLPILNISEHHTRSRFAAPEGAKLIGALLGTQSNRDVSIVNSFELIYTAGDTAADVAMDGRSTSAGTSTFRYTLDTEFLNTRKEQFKQVFPTLEVIGWYTVGERPSSDDVALHQQFATSLDTPLFLLFDPSPPVGTQDLPIKVFEAALAEGGKESETEGKFVPLEYGVETGEAERIAVDGVSRGGMGTGEESSMAGTLTTQRNAIRMLYERILVLLEYMNAVISGTAQPDHVILRQISALVATLPTMDSKGFKEELQTDYSDVQLTKYLTSLTKQLNALSEYADKNNVLHPAGNDELGGGLQGGRGGRGFDFGQGRRRRG